MLWFRQDLRLSDNPALAAALARGGAVIPVFVWAPEEEGAWPPGAASRWWLHQSLTALAAALETRGSRLIVRRGPSAQTLEALASESGASAVFWNRRYEPAAIARDAAVKTRCARAACPRKVSTAACCTSPGVFSTQPASPTAYSQHSGARTQKHRCQRRHRRQSCHRSVKSKRRKRGHTRLPLPDLKLEPTLDWPAAFREVWQPGEEGAQAHLRRFRREALSAYPVNRDRPDLPGTSRLSPHLHFGEVSPGEVWRAVMAGMRDNPKASESYLRQLVWREFAYHLLYHFPATAEQPLRPEFAKFPWRTRPKWFDAWKRGRTGYPLVDAGMRELWRTGWMHNRVRMVAASFLVKHLLISWQEGAKWFWDTLVDADLANNTLGWQWVAGSGADAAPYFRIFNPSLQADKFDPDGAYVKRWVPEVESDEYPHPIVDHAEARARALLAWEGLGK